MPPPPDQAARSAGAEESGADEMNESRCRSVGTRCRSRPAAWPSRPTAPSLVRLGDTVVLVTACAAEGAAGGRRLLPADRRLPREHLRRRQDPRRLLQARGPAHREGDPDLAPDRPPAAAAVPQGLRLRDADHRPASSRPTSRTTPTSSRSTAPRPRSTSPTSRSTRPVGAVRVGLLDGQCVVNPTNAELATKSKLEPGRRRHRGRDRDGRGRRPARSPRPRCSRRSPSATRRSSRSSTLQKQAARARSASPSAPWPSTGARPGAVAPRSRRHGRRRCSRPMRMPGQARLRRRGSRRSRTPASRSFPRTQAEKRAAVAGRLRRAAREAPAHARS